MPENAFDYEAIYRTLALVHPFCSLLAPCFTLPDLVSFAVGNSLAFQNRWDYAGMAIEVNWSLVTFPILCIEECKVKAAAPKVETAATSF